MIWLERHRHYYCSPYQIMSGVRGFEAWIFSKTKSGILGREIPTLDAAKKLCEKHKASA